MADFLVKTVAVILSAAAICLFILPFSLLGGWTLSWLWFWFIVPLGVPAIGVAHSIGIVGLVGFLTKQYNKTEETSEALSFAIIAPLMALSIGYIVHLFM